MNLSIVHFSFHQYSVKLCMYTTTETILIDKFKNNIPYVLASNFINGDMSF